MTTQDNVIYIFPWLFFKSNKKSLNSSLTSVNRRIKKNKSSIGLGKSPIDRALINCTRKTNHVSKLLHLHSPSDDNARLYRDLRIGFDKSTFFFLPPTPCLFFVFFFPSPVALPGQPWRLFSRKIYVRTIDVDDTDKLDRICLWDTRVGGYLFLHELLKYPPLRIGEWQKNCHSFV